MHELENAIQVKQALYRWGETFLVVIILLIVIFFGYFFARQIVRTNARLQAAHDDMESAKLEAEAANQSKSQFLSNMSHELRALLNSILGIYSVNAARERFD